MKIFCFTTTGHIAGAVHIDWRRDLQDQVQRDYINPAQFAQLAGRNGIGKDTTVVFYGDKAKLVGRIRALVLPSLWTRERLKQPLTFQRFLL